MKNFFLLLIVSLLISNTSTAQEVLESQNLKDFDRQCMENASFIFEGRYIKTERIPKTNPVQYAALLLVNKVYQGNLVVGDTVEVNVTSTFSYDRNGTSVRKPHRSFEPITEGTPLVYCNLSDKDAYFKDYNKKVYEPVRQGGYYSIAYKDVINNQQAMTVSATVSYDRMFYYNELKKILDGKQGIKKSKAARSEVGVNLTGRAINQTSSGGIFEFDIALSSTQSKYLISFRKLPLFSY